MYRAFGLASFAVTQDVESFRRQETTFVLLNLLVLAMLLLTHTAFSSYWGNLPWPLIVVLCAGFLLNAGELICVQTSCSRFSNLTVTALTWTSISVNMLLAFVLAVLSNRQDLQYFALLVVPVLESAFRLSWIATIGVVGVAGMLDFVWVWWYFRLHPPVVLGEYFEAGTISVIYIVMGYLVWLLVDNLRREHESLVRSLEELEEAKRNLIREEKLAAVGRLASAIAHEVRNPVAMISSSLEMALSNDTGPVERREMLEIAAGESNRLEKLTGEFLTYARPAVVEKEYRDLGPLVEYVVSVCRPHASKGSLAIATGPIGDIGIQMDSEKVEQALLNLLMNAMEASKEGDTVRISAVRQDGRVRIDVENPNGPIPENKIDQLFEPFFTTKPKGTGLGLAISRTIARAHGGDLTLSLNSPECVRFSLALPVPAERLRVKEASCG